MSTNMKFRQEKALFSIEGINTPWEEVLGLASRMTFPRGHEFETRQADSFFLLIRGSIRLSCLSESGQERVVMRIGPGTLFNEVSHMHDTLLQSYSLRTMEECEVARFSKSLLGDRNFFRNHPDLACNLIQSLGIKAGAFFAQLFDSGLLEVGTRVCRSLYQLWQENGEVSSFSPRLSQGDLAITLGVHRSSLCRVIRSLRRRGILGSFTKSRLEILDPGALAELAGGMPDSSL